jgi:hypothetical protein
MYFINDHFHTQWSILLERFSGPTYVIKRQRMAFLILCIQVVRVGSLEKLKYT